ncbi:centrosomal protein CEP104 [Marchantia polymorpha subsp. ruderalis]|nr:hypothetical protein MARPO_0010s0132 [Marchantia polymorpha]BBN12830.1 hypothetical protein Mp_5g23260 [Marchantia polymorpha subsp. ruderalis]|eukprot:PTQ46748.1 hypothetical protein MARPO_0010s0132 [Marchantia polymorpha]
MQLLCHEFKIPSKVEVFVSLTTPWIHNEKAVNQMKRLGYLSLDPNDRSGHQARELKSIHVDAPAAVIRLVLHNCYNNKLNAYNQVGLVALIITGEPLDEHQLLQIRQRGYSPLLQTPRIQVPSSKVVDANLHAVDSFTAARIHRLQKEKVTAVQDEDYDEAKRLKNLIERLKGLGEQIKQLELRKRAAVEMEDYDAAKSCKLEIERLRQCDGTGQDSLSYVSENPDSSSKHSDVSTSDNNYPKILPREEIFMSMDHQAMVMDSSAENYEDKRSGRMEGDNSTNEIVVRAKTACDPQNSIPTIQAGEKRSGVLSTVFPWWKGKEVLRHSDEDVKPAILHAPHVEYYASTSQHKPITLYPQVEQQYASTSQQKNTTLHLPHADIHASNGTQKTASLHLAHVEQYASFSNQATTHPPEEQNFGKPDQQIGVIHPHAEPFQQSASTYPPLDYSGKIANHSTIVDSPVDDHYKTGHQQLSTLHSSTDQYEKSGQHNGDLHPPVDPHPKFANIEPEPKAALHNFPFSGSVPEQNGSQTTHDHDTSVPEPLTDALRGEMGPLLGILDLYYVECLCSKQWQLRDKALQHIVKLLQSRGITGDPSSNLKLLDLVVLRAINDRVPNIYYGSLHLLKEYVTKYSGEVTPREIQHSVAAFVTILLDKLGESNVRIRDAASETLTFLASKREVGLHIVAHHMLKTPKSQSIWRPVFGRLQWLLAAIPVFGVQPNSKTGFMSEVLMSFVHQAFTSPNGEVRNAAVKVTTEVYKLMGATVERYLKGIKPIIRESCGEEGSAEEVVLTTLRASDQSPWLEADTEASYASHTETAQGNDEVQMQAEKDDWADQCLFCGKQDPSFLNGDTLDLHFCQRCPMLVGCGNCKQIVEIAALKEHYLYECTSGRRYVQCLKCSQAVPEVRLTSHLRSKECRHGKHHKAYRCPLCHHTVQPGDAGWREHLLKPPGCSKNPRTKMKMKS